MPTDITLLQPVDPIQFPVTKTWGSDKQLVSSYGRAKHFHVLYQQVDDLKGFYTVIRKYRDRYFRIYGEPTADLLLNPSSAVTRTLTNFTAPQYVHIHMLDMDKWAVPSRFDINNKQELEITIRNLLDLKGLAFLDEVDLIVLLSASQFDDVDTLSCHVYFEFDRHVPLKDLIATAKEINVKQGKIWDPAVYRPVQPDYISDPICQGFQDPVAQRLHYFPGLNGRITFEHWEKYCPKSATSRPTTQSKKKYLDWKTYLMDRCGTKTYGINEPLYRAAAKLVSEIGWVDVEANFEVYIDELYTVAWNAINAHGVRGNSDDQKNYDRKKIVSYLRPVIDKHFGEEQGDLMKELIRKIGAFEQGKSNRIYDADSIKQLAILYKKYPASYQKIKSKIKTAKIGISGIEREIKKYLRKEGFVANDIVNVLNKLIAPYTLIVTPTDEYYLMEEYTNGTYTINRVDTQSSIVKILTAKITNYTGTIINTNRTLDILLSQLAYLVSEDKLGKPTTIPVEHKTVVYRRYYDRKTVYYNVGNFKDIIRIKPGSVSMVNQTDTPILFLGSELEAPINTKLLNVKRRELRHYLYRFLTRRLGMSARNTLAGIIYMVSVIYPLELSYVLEIIGQPNSGKTTLASLLQQIVDPKAGNRNSLVLEPAPLVFVQSFRHKIAGLADNITSIPLRVADWMCRAAYGDTFDIREPYMVAPTHNPIQCGVILTALHSVVNTQDLIDRSLRINTDNNRIMQKGTAYIDSIIKCNLPVLRASLMNIVAEVIRIANSKKHVSIRGRDRLKSIVADILGVKNTAADMTNQRLDAYMSEPYTLPVLSLLQSDNFLDGDYYMVTLHNLLKDWLSKNFGNTLQVTIYDEYNRPIEKIPYTPDNQILGISNRKLGRYIGRNLKMLNRHSGYAINQKMRGKPGVLWEVKQKSLTDIVSCII